MSYRITQAGFEVGSELWVNLPLSKHREEFIIYKNGVEDFRTTTYPQAKEAVDKLTKIDGQLAIARARGVTIVDGIPEKQWPEQATPRIVCAALLFHGRLIIGPRHFDKTMRDQIKYFNKKAVGLESIQGFIDQFGRFYNRIDAWKVAEAANQIFHRCGGDGPERSGLYSENLY